MRRALAAGALCLGLAACGTPARWEKPGADEDAVKRDMTACRVAARDEAMRNYYPFAGPLFGFRYGLLWQQQAESNRFVAENNLTNFCMRNKGYELVPVAKPAPEK
jgi:hypothetical protein